MDLEKDQVIEGETLTHEELDALGEVMNMSMGSSATALSTMLEKQVLITTPKLEMMKVEDVDYSAMEPAVVVKIRYVKGILGTNIMLFRRRDMQVILNLLMGNDNPQSDEDFEFDDMSISAACEVTNQMMGSSATALSKVLDTTVDISTPEAFVTSSENAASQTFTDIEPGTRVVSIAFTLDIEGTMNTNYMSVMPINFAKGIIDHLLPTEEPAPAQEPAPAPEAAVPPVQQAAAPSQPQQPPQQQPAAQPNAAVPPAMNPGMPQQQPMQQPMQGGYMPMPQGYPNQQAMYMQPGMMPPQGYPQPQFYAPQQPQFSGPMGNMVGGEVSPVTVKKAQFPDFTVEDTAEPLNSANMGLLMNVSLDVSVEIGRTKRKIKDISEFGQGTVLELEKQAGAPVDIIVNGQLLAHGDVVVIGDNFGVRITEIVGVKELMDSLTPH